jgi:1-acyl-sn-glycerol-3-phosphate acyltransferase
MIRTYLLAVILSVYMVVIGGPLLLLAIFTGRTGALYHAGVLGAKLVLWLGGVKVKVSGIEKIPCARAAVYMPNHQSNYDSPALLSLLPPVLVMAKKEFFRVPFLGPAMRVCGFIPVDRRDRERAITAIEIATARLRAGHSFLAYPEGTRSSNGRLRPFKKGVFIMAIEAGSPVVPISISGAFKILRKGERRVHPGTIRITVHDPIPTHGLNPHDLGALMAKVRQAIISGLAEDERPLDAAAAHGESE